MSYLPAAAFDIYSDSFFSTTLQFLDFSVLFVVFVWVAIFFSQVCRAMGWDSPLEAYYVRTLCWIFSYSRITRLEFEAAAQTFFIVVLYLSMSITT
jgi:hypothetical protein